VALRRRPTSPCGRSSCRWCRASWPAGRRRPPRPWAADPADPPRDPPPAHRNDPAAGRIRRTAALVALAAPAL